VPGKPLPDPDWAIIVCRARPQEETGVITRECEAHRTGLLDSQGGHGFLEEGTINLKWPIVSQQICDFVERLEKP
jgi:hypothetical protein